MLNQAAGLVGEHGIRCSAVRPSLTVFRRWRMMGLLDFAGWSTRPVSNFIPAQTELVQLVLYFVKRLFQNCGI